MRRGPEIVLHFNLGRAYNERGARMSRTIYFCDAEIEAAANHVCACVWHEPILENIPFELEHGHIPPKFHCNFSCACISYIPNIGERMCLINLVGRNSQIVLIESSDEPGTFIHNRF